jgi:hypothetical protein
VEAALASNVANNFSEFHQVFDSFESMKHDFTDIRDKTQLSRQILADLKEDQVQGMLRVYAL